MDEAMLAMNDDAMTEAVHLAKMILPIEGATLPINDARRLRDLVEMMARVIRTEPARHPTTTPQSEATLDDAARYLRAVAAWRADDVRDVRDRRGVASVVVAARPRRGGVRAVRRG